MTKKLYLYSSFELNYDLGRVSIFVLKDFILGPQFDDPIKTKQKITKRQLLGVIILIFLIFFY